MWHIEYVLNKATDQKSVCDRGKFSVDIILLSLIINTKANMHTNYFNQIAK